MTTCWLYFRLTNRRLYKVHIKSALWDATHGILEYWWGVFVGKGPELLLGAAEHFHPGRKDSCPLLPCHSPLSKGLDGLQILPSHLASWSMECDDGVIGLAGIEGWDYEARHWRWGWRRGPSCQQTPRWQFWSSLDSLATSLFGVVQELHFLFVLYFVMSRCFQSLSLGNEFIWL